MPPRYAYWTILVDGQATAFRAAQQDDLMPTFKRLKIKHPSAVLMWFQNGKLWPSRLDAQEAMRERGERGRSADPKQSGFRGRKKLEWQPKSGPATEHRTKLEWRPPGEKPHREKPRGKDPRGEKPGLDWKPRGATPSKMARPRDERTSRAPGRTSGERQPEGRRDRTWRPGGDHKDPRQKYKDAKKAKWQRFKKTIRTRWETHQGKKRRDEES